MSIDAVFIQIKNFDLEIEQPVFNDGLSMEQKINILENFNILRPLGKRILHYSSSFVLRKYHRKEIIYRIGDNSDFVYFIVSG